MNFNFQFSNLLGTVYRRGNLIFSPDGNTLFSPVGNKISAFDLKAHKSETLNIEGRHDYTCMALSPNGVLLLAANEDGEVHLISLISKTILQNLRTNRTISALSFSPDGKQFAIAKENLVLVYRTPGAQNKDYNPFGLDRVLKGAFDDTITLTWSSCSRVVAVGSKDNTTRLYAVREKFSNFSSYCLGGHSDPIVSSFFEEDSLNCYTLSRNGHLVHWEASLEPEELVPLKKLEQKKKGGKKSNKKKGDDEEEEEEDDMPENLEEDNTEDKADAVTADNETSQASKLFYTRKFRHFLRDALPKEEQKKQDSADSEAAKKSNKRAVDVTAADFHANLKLLVTGFSNGVFLIHEMPDANMIHSLSISEQSIMSVTFNPSGDWIAFGCSKLGQLLVWEWQSETYVLKQQGHFNNMACVSFSPDGTNMATGGQDGKVKLWTSLTGFCYVTFTEHTASVTAVRYSIGKNNVVFSASLDGTVRAFDTTRYRNFRTFTSPRPAQFSSLSVDLSGDLVASGATDVYEVFLWSVQTGHLLEVISGHEGPVSSLAFNPSPANGSSQLATVSWDKTMKIWDALDANSSNTETIQIMADATALAFRPDGLQVAVATLNGQITFFHPVSGTQTGSIEGRGDLTVGRSDTDLITPKKAKAFFTALSYTADGQFILAGGQSKTICIYHVGQNLLVKKFEVTQNRSFDAMDDVISRKKMTEFGNLSLVEDRDDPRGKMAIKLPGTRKGDLSSRAHRPQVSVSGLEFSPTGREFAAATTEGLLMFSLDSKMIFDPFELEEEVTPKMTRGLVVSRDYGRALSMALRLNEPDLIREVMEQIPPDQVDLLTSRLSEKLVYHVLKFIGAELETTRHLGFYSKWSFCVLKHHGLWIKRKSRDLLPILNQLQKALTNKSSDLTDLCERNVQTLDFLITMCNVRKNKKATILTETIDENDTSDDEEIVEGMDFEIVQTNELQSKWSDDDE